MVKVVEQALAHHNKYRNQSLIKADECGFLFVFRISPVGSLAAFPARYAEIAEINLTFR